MRVAGCSQAGPRAPTLAGRPGASSSEEVMAGREKRKKEKKKKKKKEINSFFFLKIKIFILNIKKKI